MQLSESMTAMSKITIVPHVKTLKFDDKGLFWTIEAFEKNGTFVNIAVGGRGIGKTFDIKRKRHIDKFLNSRKRFVYVRYFDSELNPQEFFEKIANFYPEHEFGYGAKKPGEPIHLYIDGEVAGYMIAIKTAYKAKSIDFMDVKTIHFDEFLAPIGTQGVPDHAPEIFEELLETILRDGSDLDARIYLTANAVDLSNDFFVRYHVPVEELSKIKGRCIKINDLVSFEYCLTSEAFKQRKAQTNLGKLFKLTGHWSYAVDNAFIEGVLPDQLRSAEKISYKSGSGFCVRYDDGYLIISKSKYKYSYMCEFKKELPLGLSSGYRKITFELGLSDKAFTFDDGAISDSSRGSIYAAICNNDARFDGQKAFSRCLKWFNLTTKW